MSSPPHCHRPQALSRGHSRHSMPFNRFSFSLSSTSRSVFIVPSRFLQRPPTPFRERRPTIVEVAVPVMSDIDLAYLVWRSRFETETLRMKGSNLMHDPRMPNSPPRTSQNCARRGRAHYIPFRRLYTLHPSLSASFRCSHPRRRSTYSLTLPVPNRRDRTASSTRVGIIPQGTG